MARHRANGKDFSLDIPFYRTYPVRPFLVKLTARGTIEPWQASSMKPREICFGLMEDGEIGVGVFPQGKKLLVLRAGVG